MSGAELRLALVGAGAVAEKRYLPAASGLEELAVTHLVDLDLERARRLAAEHGVPHAAREVEEVLDDVDAAVVATPPSTHRALATACLERGVHVLCEKPLAADPNEARAMVEAARGADALLSVGMIWRLSRSARLLRRCVDLGLPGEIRRVEAEHGGAFGWPVRGGHIFDAAQGGVLRDTGVHLLDLVFWVVGAEEARVDDYRDDSWGGAEANARVELEIETGSTAFGGDVEVSFTRELENRVRIRGAAGTLEAPTLGGGEAMFRPAGEETRIRLIEGDGSARSRTEDFALQLRTFARAVREGGPAPVPSASAVLPLAVIAECHRLRRPEVRAWEAPPRDPGAGPPEPAESRA